MFSHIGGWPDPAVFRTMRRETQRSVEDRALPYPGGTHEAKSRCRVAGERAGVRDSYGVS
ncbi:uncharacterized protein METZ01_LOCUS175281 [marine metagenome]|uniref:Uncharacterized protein n=1 Tax=marine metagenome TaxID=408172 RepID=A0A382CAQ5_9ZZZZ